MKGRVVLLEESCKAGRSDQESSLCLNLEAFAMEFMFIMYREERNKRAK